MPLSGNLDAGHRFRLLLRSLHQPSRKEPNRGLDDGTLADSAPDDGGPDKPLPPLLKRSSTPTTTSRSESSRACSSVSDA